jgi:hypothetical protein
VATFTAPFSGVPGWADYNQYRLRLEAYEGTVDPPNNRSIAIGDLYVDKNHGDGYYSGYGGSPAGISGDISGGTSWGPYDFSAYTTLYLGSWSAWVTHNADGTRVASGGFSASDSADPTIGSASGGWAIGLTTIQRDALERFDGSSWKNNYLERFDGSSWKQQVLERYTGSVWVRET